MQWCDRQYSASKCKQSAFLCRGLRCEAHAKDIRNILSLSLSCVLHFPLQEGGGRTFFRNPSIHLSPIWVSPPSLPHHGKRKESSPSLALACGGGRRRGDSGTLQLCSRRYLLPASLSCDDSCMPAPAAVTPWKREGPCVCTFHPFGCFTQSEDGASDMAAFSCHLTRKVIHRQNIFLTDKRLALVTLHGAILQSFYSSQDFFVVPVIPSSPGFSV